MLAKSYSIVPLRYSPFLSTALPRLDYDVALVWDPGLEDVSANLSDRVWGRVVEVHMSHYKTEGYLFSSSNR